jgi:hypothetical protein
MSMGTRVRWDDVDTTLATGFVHEGQIDATAILRRRRYFIRTTEELNRPGIAGDSTV